MFVHMEALPFQLVLLVCRTPRLRGSLSRVFSVTLGECRFLCWQHGQPVIVGSGEVQITSV